MDILRAQEHNKELHEQFNHQVRYDLAFRNISYFITLITGNQKTYQISIASIRKNISVDDEGIVRLCG